MAKTMTVTVQSVIDRVQAVLQDTTGVRWPVVDELVLWVNDAQREIALLKPDASAKNETITLAAGTKQSIPAGGNRLLKVHSSLFELLIRIAIYQAPGNRQVTIKPGI